MQKDRAPGLELANDLLQSNYPQKFVQSTEVPRRTINDMAKQAPSLEQVMHGFTKYPCY